MPKPKICIFMHSSHLQNFLIKRSKFTLNPAARAALWWGVCSSSEDGCVVLELLWGRVLGTGEDLRHNYTCFTHHSSNLQVFISKGWCFVTLVAFLLPLILSTLAWASRIRSETLCSWRRFLSTLSETLWKQHQHEIKISCIFKEIDTFIAQQKEVCSNTRFLLESWFFLFKQSK